MSERHIHPIHEIRKAVDPVYRANESYIPKEFPSIIPYEATSGDLMYDLRAIGEMKPVGHIPILTIKQFGQDVDALQQELESRNIFTRIWTRKKDGIRIWEPQGAMYATDRKSLQELLQEHSAVVRKANWPLDPEQFLF